MNKTKYGETILLNLLQEYWGKLEYGHEIHVCPQWVEAIAKIAKREGWK